MDEKKDIDKLLELIEPKIQEAKKIAGRLILLKIKTEIEKTQFNQIKASVSKCLDEFDVKSFSAEDQSMITELVHRNDSFESLSELERSEVYKTYKELEDIKDWKLKINFDQPKLLNIWVSYTNGHSKVIDIVKSIEKNYENIGHPLILKAIGHYRSVLASRKLANIRKNNTPKTPLLSLNPERALDCLNKINNVLIQVPKLSSDDQFLKLLAIVNRDDYDAEYFQKIVELLNSKSVKNYRTPSNKIMYLRLGLEREFPSLEHEEIFSWLSDRLKNKNLPKRLDGNTLKNDFWAWKWNVKPASAKSELSRLLKTQKNFEDFIIKEEDFETMSDELIFNLTGYIIMPGHLDLSGLVESKRELTDIPHSNSSS